MLKKWTLKIEFANFTILLLNQSPINTIPWKPKIRAIRGPPVVVIVKVCTVMYAVLNVPVFTTTK